MDWLDTTRLMGGEGTGLRGGTKRNRGVCTECAEHPHAFLSCDKDSAVPVERSREWVKKLKELGTHVEYNEYPGINHNSWENALCRRIHLHLVFSVQTQTQLLPLKRAIYIGSIQV